MNRSTFNIYRKNVVAKIAYVHGTSEHLQKVYFIHHILDMANKTAINVTYIPLLPHPKKEEEEINERERGKKPYSMSSSVVPR